jgi:ABC-type nickel/cobalt efflux system permease component RcnA
MNLSYRLLPAVLLPLVFYSHQAFAHPLGNFSINRYSRLELSQEKVYIHYIVDMAEIPTLQERGVIDDNNDFFLSDEECDRYSKKHAERMTQGLTLTINSAPASLKLVDEGITFHPGVGGFYAQRLAMVLEAVLPPPSRVGAWKLEYHDINYKDRLGWKEIIARPLEGVELVESNVPQQDQSDELRQYPPEMLYNPLSMQNVQLTFKPATGVSTVEGEKMRKTGALVRAKDKVWRLITPQTLTLPVILIALFGAMGLGAVHALSPGHGKSIVAAYLIGSRGTVKHALFLGATVTVTHTFGVFMLGFITLFASQYILPERLYPWLSVLSGIIVFLIGAAMLVKRIRSLLHPNTYVNHHYDHHAHGHHTHVAANQTHHHSSDHGNHDHNHHKPYFDQEEDVHKHDSANHLHNHSYCAHSHDIIPNHHQDHHHGHAHLPPGLGGSSVTWKSLLALGVSGGILPCPSALVVLLAAISMQRIGFGLILILAFSLGLAAVLTGIGLLFVKARQFADRIPSAGSVMRLLPAISAFVIIAIGIGIALNAMRQIL